MPELSDQQLKFGYWYFLHRATLRRALIGLFVVAIAALWGYAGWQLVDWLAGKRADDELVQQLTSTTVNSQDYLKRHQPLPLEVGTATAVPSGNGRYDLLAEVRNPNPTWGLKALSYTLTADGQVFSGSGFLLPLEDSYLVSLGAKLAAQPAQVSFAAAGLAWQRVRNVTDFTVPTFTVANQKLEQLSPLTPGGSPVARLRFDLTNDSALSFWRMNVVVVLMNGNVPQAVGQQQLTNIESARTYPVEFSWPRGLPPVDHVVVKPEVNVFDPEVLKPVQ